MPELWLPGSAQDKVQVQGAEKRMLPSQRKKDGGSYFDDEMETEAEHNERILDNAVELVQHINARPDHKVYVGSIEDRDQMRQVFNWWKREGWIGHNPDIRIEYGVPDGAVRVAE